MPVSGLDIQLEPSENENPVSKKTNGNTAFEQDTWISAKTRMFRKLIKLVNALSMYNTKNQVMNFCVCTKCCDACEKKKHFAQH